MEAAVTKCSIYLLIMALEVGSEMRRARAERVVREAATDTVEAMIRLGWHQSSDVLDESDAILVTEDQLGDPDYEVAVTRTCAGLIVWTMLRV